MAKKKILNRESRISLNDGVFGVEFFKVINILEHLLGFSFLFFFFLLGLKGRKRVKKSTFSPKNGR